MPSEQELLPSACPFCGDSMIIDNSDTIRHIDGSECIIGQQAWSAEPKFLNAWNVRTRPVADAMAPTLSNQMDGDKALIALRAARQFITNGVEFGYIRMPDTDTPDSAHDTPGLIDEAIASLAARAPDKALREALERLVHDVIDLAGNSTGVAGLHQNGDLAEWSDLLEGGQFEPWLGEAMAQAEQALSAPTPAPDKALMPEAAVGLPEAANENIKIDQHHRLAARLEQIIAQDQSDAMGLTISRQSLALIVSALRTAGGL